MSPRDPLDYKEGRGNYYRASGKQVCFVCGKDNPPYRKGICSRCWEQAEKRAREEDAL